MKNKLNFIVWIDRFDYVSGYNNMFHKLAENLHNLGENVYTLGVGKKNFKYKLFPIENFDPINNNQFEIDSPDTNIRFDFSKTSLDPESTIFITHHRCEYKYLSPFKSVRYVCDPDSLSQAPFDSDKTLFFYHFLAYSTKNFKYDGLLRWIDIDTSFWYPSASVPLYNTFLIKKLSAYLKNDELVKYVNNNLNEVSKITKLNKFECIDNLAGAIQPTPDANKQLVTAQRQVWSQSEFFISFDQHTAQTIFSTLCGANTIIIPSPNLWEPKFYKADEYREIFYPYASPGVAYGLDDIDYMFKTKHLLRKHIKESKEVYLDDIKKFIRICYEKF